MFFIIVVCIGLSSFTQRVMFGLGGENLTLLLRIKLFDAVLRKHVGWFDSADKAPGILTNIITEDISQVNGLTTEVVGIIVEAALGLTVSSLICAIFSWQLAILVTLLSPLMVLGGLGMASLQLNQAAVVDSYMQANALLSDLVMNYRTVISFGQKNVDFILERYAELLIVPQQAGVKRAHISGLFFGYSQCIRFIFIAIVFYVASVVQQSADLDPQKVYTGCYCVFVGSIGCGVSISQMPSIAAAKAAAKTVFGIINEPSKIDPKQTGVESVTEGRISLTDVYFRYPSRKRYVLKNFKLDIQPNQSVAIVGHSGSGKSTIASLILRFYDVSHGSVAIDGMNIKNYNMEYLRQKISVVQQEPLLFNETIKSNILFGDLHATDPRVREVAVQANALGFIMQNDDDVNDKKVQDKIRTAFREVSRRYLNIDQSRYVNLLSVLEAVDSGRLDYKELALINEIIPNLSEEGKIRLESEFANFLEAVSAKAYQADTTWQSTLRYFDFLPEMRKIQQQYGLSEAGQVKNVDDGFVNDRDPQGAILLNPSGRGSDPETSDQIHDSLSDEHKKEIKAALQVNQCQFDLQTVQDFIVESKIKKEDGTENGLKF